MCVVSVWLSVCWCVLVLCVGVYLNVVVTHNYFHNYQVLSISKMLASSAKIAASAARTFTSTAASVRSGRTGRSSFVIEGAGGWDG